MLETGASPSGIGLFHETTGPFAAGTRDQALALAKREGWTPDRQRLARARLKAALERELDRRAA